MKVTFVNTHDLIGGAERCSYDLASHLHQQGEDISLIVGRKFGTDVFVKQVKYRFLDYTFRHFVFWKLGITDALLAAPIYNSFLWPELKQADVYNIHNMHGSFWNFWTLPILARRAPIVLTLHDEWFMTGDCAYTYDCEKWLKECGNCPQASITKIENRYAIGGRDTTRLNLRLKRLCTRNVPASKMVIVSPSKWLLQRAKQAPHLRKYDFYHIENGIDLTIYRPLNKIECQKELGLPVNRRLIFTAAAKFEDRRKNFKLVDTVLRSRNWPKDTILVCAGRLSVEQKRTYEGLPVIFLGYLEGREQMAMAFSACDFSLLLSNADNLPYTGLEALACGCPVIGSNVGGISEIVDDGSTGWLLPKDCPPEDLAETIHRVCQKPISAQEKMRHQARAKAERSYGMDRFVEKYRKLFADVISRCA